MILQLVGTIIGGGLKFLASRDKAEREERRAAVREAARALREKGGAKRTVFGWALVTLVLASIVGDLGFTGGKNLLDLLALMQLVASL